MNSRTNKKTGNRNPVKLKKKPATGTASMIDVQRVPRRSEIRRAKRAQAVAA
jgi:hypothetical protein